MSDLTNEELEKLATDDQKQMALSVAIDAYDKRGTYFDELRKIVKNMNSTNNIVKELVDSEYQETHSQVSRAIMDVYPNEWPNFKWGKDTNGNLYWTGAISGKSSKDKWSLVRNWQLPFSEKDIVKVAKFLTES